jgi:hypothetical protein
MTRREIEKQLRAINSSFELRRGVCGWYVWHTRRKGLQLAKVFRTPRDCLTAIKRQQQDGRQ